MEKLSRSQRYASLRESMAQDREESTLTNDLSKYQNTLNGLQNASVQTNTVTPAATAPVTPVQPVAQPYVETPAAPVQPVIQPVAAPVVETPAANSNTSAGDIDSLLSALEAEVANTPVAEAPAKEEPAINSLDDFLNSINSTLDTAEPVAAPVAAPAVEVPVQPAVEPVKEPVSSLDDFDFDSFLNETLVEVQNANKEKGLTTLEDIPQNIITEVKAQAEVKPEPVVEKIEETPVVEPAPAVEKPAEVKQVEIFDETAKAEIDKMMSEISINSGNEPVEPSTPVAPVVAPTVANLVDDFLAKEEPANEHPVAVETLEEDKNGDAVEIMNLADLEKTESLTKTMTFAAPEEETEEDTDTPNKVLNVLLVVLIVALFLVLGFVVYELISANII